MKNPLPKRSAEQNPAADLEQRKLNHLKACLGDEVDLGRDSFAKWKLRYQALPELSLAEVSTKTQFANRPIAAPLLISCMTGGVGDPFISLNRNLAEGAEALGIPLGLGSMKVMLANDDAKASYQIRKYAPSIPIIANLGLVSFNYGLSFEHVERIIESIEPNVFCFHLNALQEVIQEGGDTDFRRLTDALGKIVQRCPIPVYVKECGGGIEPETVAILAEMGVEYIDISGSDGTSWAAVEAKLSSEPDFGDLFRDFGLPTAWILEKLTPHQRKEAGIIASGGIRNGIQAAKALAMGADYVSMARPFYLAATESAEAVANLGEQFIRELRTAMFLSGCGDLASLGKKALIES